MNPPKAGEIEDENDKATDGDRSQDQDFRVELYFGHGTLQNGTVALTVE